MKENEEQAIELRAVKDWLDALEVFYEEMTDQAKNEYNLLHETWEVIEKQKLNANQRAESLKEIIQRAQ